MVSHSGKTRAAKSAKVYGRGAQERPTEKGVALDQAPCEGLEEPGAPGARELLNSVEELDCRVAEVERNMLVLGQRADRGCRAWGACEVLGKRVDAHQRDLQGLHAAARIDREECERRQRLLAAAVAVLVVCLLVLLVALGGR